MSAVHSYCQYSDCVTQSGSLCRATYVYNCSELYSVVQEVVGSNPITPLLGVVAQLAERLTEAYVILTAVVQ